MSLFQIYPDLDGSPDLRIVSPVVEKVDIIVVPGQYSGRRSLTGSGNRDHLTKAFVDDLLPSDFPHSRILFFDYNPHSAFRFGFTENRLQVVTLHLLQHAIKLRKKDPLRPIIFIAHGVGGILVKNALLRAALDSRFKTIRRATKGIAFFGTPHRARSLDATLETLVSDFASQLWISDSCQTKTSRKAPYFVRTSSSFSALLSAERFHDEWLSRYSRRLRFLSFYGQTPSLAVPGQSATLGLPQEQEAMIALPSSQQDFWAFEGSTDPNYCIFRNKLAWLLGWIAQSDPIRYSLEFQDLKWLRQLYPSGLKSRENLIQDPVEGTFQWIWSNSSFKSWLSADRSTTMWLTGKPGSGKSVMLRYVSNYLCTVADDIPYEPLAVARRSFAVANFFCDFSAPPKSSESILRSLLHQVLSGQPSLLRYLTPVVKRKHQWSTGTDFSLVTALREISKHRSIVCVIDALDECDVVVRTNLLNALADHLVAPAEDSWRSPCAVHASCACRTSSPKLKILFSSRPFLSVQVSNHENHHVQHLSLSVGEAASSLAKDFQAVVKSTFPLLGSNDEVERRQDIASRIVERSDGVFLWVKLVLKSLLALEVQTSENLLSQLEKHPTNLNDMYSSILSSVNEKNADEKSYILRCLDWVVFARRPLRVEELAAAVAFETESGYQHDFPTSVHPPSFLDLRYKFRPRSIRFCFSQVPLIEVKGSTVHLIHRSVKDFMSSTAHTAASSVLLPQVSRRTDIDVNTRIAVICLAYLRKLSRSDRSSDGVPQNHSMLDTEVAFPLYTYAATYWSSHEKASAQHQEYPDEIVHNLSHGASVNSRWQLPDDESKHTYRTMGSKPCKWRGMITPLALAVSQNDMEMIEVLSSSSVSFEDYDYLSLAASTGAFGAVQFLLKQGLKVPNDRQRHSALLAADRGHTEIVKVLLDHNRSLLPVEKSKGLIRDWFGHLSRSVAIKLSLLPAFTAEDAFLDACEACSLESIKSFLNIGISPDAGRNGSHAIHFVLNDSGHWDRPSRESEKLHALETLLDRGAQIGQKDEHGNTCLHLAAKRGENEIAQDLVSFGCPVNERNQLGETAADTVALQGNAAWLQQLLVSGAEPDTLTWKNALKSGSIDTVSVLLRFYRRFCHEGIELSPIPSEVYHHYLMCGDVPLCYTAAVAYLRSRHIMNQSSIRIEVDRSLTCLELLQGGWEDLTETTWGWWPLKPPLPQLNPDEAWICWKCFNCNGKEHRDRIPSQLGVQIRALVDFLSVLSQVALETTGRSPRPSNNQWFISPGTVCSLDSGENTPTRPSEHVGNAPLRRPASGSTGQSPNRPRGLETPHSNPRRRHVSEPQRLAASSMTEKTSNSRNAGGKPLDDEKPNPEEKEPGTRVKGRFVVIKAVSFPHDHIEIQATTTDLTFLDDLQTKYWARCSTFKTYLSIHRFHHWGFDRYEHFNGNYISIANGCASSTTLPEAPHDLDYDFKRLANESPPVSQPIFYSHCYDCKPDCSRIKLLHSCTNTSTGKFDEECVPEHSDRMAELLSRVPKRLLEWQPRNLDHEVAYGLSSFELPNAWGFCIYSILCFLLPAGLFWIFWLSIMGYEADLQNASVPATLAVVLWVTLYQSTAGKRWCRKMQY
ncbi:hypothetical protein CSIM01_06817 [Colletotrichum simmondsii]|uniref:Nephrocystin 3-like N-terminal domain-containing protein n=1 Tax=Colletotrichum simmondsii TaxID=703756 RepID=A0A135TF52_9PEZI|nr:hypothetical protein CSIM01_06817 [Colletotrichum simmondsii]